MHFLVRSPSGNEVIHGNNTDGQLFPPPHTHFLNMLTCQWICLLASEMMPDKRGLQLEHPNLCTTLVFLFKCDTKGGGGHHKTKSTPAATHCGSCSQPLAVFSYRRRKAHCSLITELSSTFYASHYIAIAEDHTPGLNSPPRDVSALRILLPLFAWTVPWSLSGWTVQWHWGCSSEHWLQNQDPSVCSGQRWSWLQDRLGALLVPSNGVGGESSCDCSFQWI